MGEFKPAFMFDVCRKCPYEGWMLKSKVRKVIGDSWQRRYFRLQDRCLYYFKDPLEGQNGYIPLMNIKLQDLPEKRAKNGFMIVLDKSVIAAGLAKRDEYPIAAESEEARVEWKRAIVRYSADRLVGEPYLAACKVTPTERRTELLLPYFLGPLLSVLDTTGLKTPSVWVYPQPPAVTAPYLFTINQNLPLSCSEPHVAAGVIVAWLRAMPDSPFPADAVTSRGDRATVDCIRDWLRVSPAPVRELVRVLGWHLRNIIQSPATGVAAQQLVFLGPLILKSRGSDAQRAQFIPTLIEHADDLLSDVHSFGTTFSGPPVARGKLSKPQLDEGGSLLVGPMGMLIFIARIDASGWGVCYTAARKVGLVHQSGWTSLSRQEEADVDAGQGIDVMLSVAREKCPKIHLVLDGMVAEIAALRQVLGDGP